MHLSNPMVNGLGVKSLADFQGRPSVEFWGTMEALASSAVPASIKMQKSW
jgi:hypothetical protein